MEVTSAFSAVAGAFSNYTITFQTSQIVGEDGVCSLAIFTRIERRVSTVDVILMKVNLFHCRATATMNWSIRWSSGQCLGWLIDQLVMMEIITIMVEVILVMRCELICPVSSPLALLRDHFRVYILYNRCKLVLSAIILAFVAEIITMVTALALAVPKIEFENHCYVLSTPSFYVAYW